ncbi:MAG: RNA polymerase sigma factor [Planctomycetota bacterium]|jgi:RNA polymerase sigma-70 factor (ECF subfamily)
MKTTEISDKELVNYVLNGDIDRFEGLYRRYYSSMVAIAYCVLREHNLAEDAAQQAFLRALRNLRSLRHKDKFASWLSRLCKNVAKDMVTSKPGRTKTIEISKLQLPDKTNEDDTSRGVRQALESISPSAKELVVLRYYDNLSYEQIAVVLDVSEATIGRKLRKAKRNIAKYLQYNGFLEKV